MIEVLRSGQLSLGPRIPAFERPSPRGSASRTRARSPPAPPALHLGLRAIGVEEGDEVVTSPFSFVASANSILYEGARPVFADIDPRTLNLDPGGRRGRDHRPHHRAAAGAHLRLPGRPARARGARPADRRGRLRGARRRARRRRRRSAAAATRRRSASTPTSSSRPARAGCSRSASAEHKARVDSERNQGRAPDMGWLDHDRLGFNYRMTDIQAAIGLVQLERLDGMLADRARVAGALPRGAGRHRGPRAAVRGRRRRRARLVRVRGPAPARRRPRRRDGRPARSAACSPSPTCRRST